jgi:carboxyl-terminal processing protease
MNRQATIGTRSDAMRSMTTDRKNLPASHGRVLMLGAIALGLAACGGGGSGTAAEPGDSPESGDTTFDWTAGIFQPSSTFADVCAEPRAGSDPDSGLPYPDVQGTTTDENNWLRSWSNELYLWYDEIVDRNPADYTTAHYFELLKTTAITASGQPKDRFHFSMPTADWLQLAQSGKSSGYGARFAVLSESPPRDVVVAYTEPGSPATATPASLMRGARILQIDGVDVVYADSPAEIDVLNAGLFPESTGETHAFTVRDAGASETRTISLTSAEVTADPVPSVTTFDTPTGRVGYLLFNSHIATSELALITAIETLDTASIDDLVLDIRYNGGGFLYIASELAYMIAGPTATAARTFEKLQFNDKHPTVNPVTGNVLEPVPFFTAALGYSAPEGEPLPSLNLPRLYVLTGAGTCSASESIINALRGVDLEVVLVGETTCGKPFGFYPQDNCGTTYFSIQFVGVNDKGFGEYTDGFSPANSNSGSTLLPGCAVADDFDYALGDPAEARLAAALAYRDFGTCPAATAFGPRTLSKVEVDAGDDDARLLRPFWETIRLIGGP